MEGQGDGPINDAVDAELHYLRQTGRPDPKSSESYKAYQLEVQMEVYAEDLEADEDLDHWDRERFRKLTDFDYRFRHREHMHPWMRRRYQYVAGKLMHVQKNGKPGYFRRLVENGIDFKSEISVIASMPGTWAEDVCKCGIGTKVFPKNKWNSGRCHKHHFCRLCSWVDYGRLLKESYGQRTRTFFRAAAAGQRFLAIHLSVRDHRENARAIGRTLKEEDFDILNLDHGLYSEIYASHPVHLGGTEGRDDISGLITCHRVSNACMKALRSVYKQGWLRGLKAKLETAFQLRPAKALPHLHAIATADLEVDPQFLADELKAEMDAVLESFISDLQLPLYASVRVFAIESPEHLESAAEYLEKVVPLGLLVNEALDRNRALDPDGKRNAQFYELLEHELINLAEQEVHLSSGFKAQGQEFAATRYRLSLGNLVYGKKTTIPDEPIWHRQRRIRHAKRAAQARARKRHKKLIMTERRKTRVRAPEPGGPRINGRVHPPKSDPTSVVPSTQQDVPDFRAQAVVHQPEATAARFSGRTPAKPTMASENRSPLARNGIPGDRVGKRTGAPGGTGRGQAKVNVDEVVGKFPARGPAPGHAENHEATENMESGQEMLAAVDREYATECTPSSGPTKNPRDSRPWSTRVHAPNRPSPTMPSLIQRPPGIMAESMVMEGRASSGLAVLVDARCPDATRTRPNSQIYHPGIQGHQQGAGLNLATEVEIQGSKPKQKRILDPTAPQPANQCGRLLTKSTQLLGRPLPPGLPRATNFPVKAGSEGETAT